MSLTQPTCTIAHFLMQKACDKHFIIMTSTALGVIYNNPSPPNTGEELTFKVLITQLV